MRRTIALALAAAAAVALPAAGGSAQRIDYAKVASEVFLATDTAAMMKEMGMTPPDPTKKTIVVMGKAFDPAKPQAYVDSFAIKRS